MTKYAQQILDLVLCSTGHPTAEQIFLQMKQENSKIAQATVYNNLNALVAANSSACRSPARPTATTTPRATIT